jgi:hypothetical protein
MPLQSDFSFSDESPSNITPLISNQLPLLERIGFRQAKAENDDQNRRAGTEPEEWTPSMRCGIDKTSGKGCS